MFQVGTTGKSVIFLTAINEYNANEDRNSSNNLLSSTLCIFTLAVSLSDIVVHCK
jgi:hypothetical protein